MNLRPPRSAGLILGILNLRSLMQEAIMRLNAKLTSFLATLILPLLLPTSTCMSHEACMSHEEGFERLEPVKAACKAYSSFLLENVRFN